MTESHQNLPLKFDVAKVVFLFKDCLVKYLHSVVRALSILLLLFHEKYFSEAPLTQQANHSYRTQVNLVTEVLRCVGPTSLHHVVMKA